MLRIAPSSHPNYARDARGIEGGNVPALNLMLTTVNFRETLRIELWLQAVSLLVIVSEASPCLAVTLLCALMQALVLVYVSQARISRANLR